jgi:hypothetical protein
VFCTRQSKLAQQMSAWTKNKKTQLKQLIQRKSGLIETQLLVPASHEISRQYGIRTFISVITTARHRSLN